LNVIKAEKIFANQAYVLRCIAVPLLDSGVHAKVEIIPYENQADISSATAFTPAAPFPSRAAIEHVRAWGMKWIRNNG
jgi:hypothetical protein